MQTSMQSRGLMRLTNPCAPTLVWLTVSTVLIWYGARARYEFPITLSEDTAGKQRILSKIMLDGRHTMREK